MNEIDPNATYIVVDLHTGKTVHKTTYSKRNHARRKADRLDNAYGAVRYVCKLA